eukprot:CAMPEP_0114669976 /NCGR_PEP_ID=MMETSP0191-20121206/38851_1 /TAXON_ID=126664 /ORGANISM="Sorites sp." /LENGTH=249 /DNA_ID=CAMNT_0001926667 /DNA_START=144 /DNA_END=893 /DNA_ORIENTATION=-
MSLRIFNKSSKHLNNATKVMSITSLVLQSKRGGYWNGIYLGPGHIDIDLSDGATKPDGVPETWTSIDIPNVDFGKFDEDCFPPALEGETLEEYCRRVPNVWSPDSNATDTVEMLVYMGLDWACGLGPPMMGMMEEALIKIPPESADWHVTYEPDYETMLKEMMFRNRPFPIRVSDAEFEIMLNEFKAGVEKKGIDYRFRARSFHEFWIELTDKELKTIANVPTWEEEIDKRIEEAKKERIIIIITNSIN